MPITITPVGPGNFVGPGLQVSFATVGPVPTGTSLQVSWFTDADRTNLFFFDDILNVTNFVSYTPMTHQQRSHVNADVGLKDGDTIYWQAFFQDQDGNQVDSGTGTAIWSNTVGIWPLVQSIPASSTSGGLTPQQDATLTEIHTAAVPTVSLDSLTLSELTSGPTGGNVSAFLPTPSFGIIVRLDQVPETLQPKTPDLDYWVTTLASVRVFRGSDIWLRVPIHRSSQIISFTDQNLLVAVPAVTLTQWLLQLSVQVDFLPGVTGQVFSMNFP